MGNSLKAAMGIAGLVLATSAAAQVTLYSRDDFGGQSFTTDRNVHNLERAGFNDFASSALVRGGAWQVCEDAEFSGRCVTLQPGEYPSLSAMHLNNRISSIRAADGQYGYSDDRGYVAQGPNDRAYVAPAPNDRAYVAQGGNDYRRRPDERLFDVPVTSVHAVVGPPEQRCWVEREEPAGHGANVPGAIAGAVIGGILGHQIGSGHGQDIATAGGAVAGAAVGANAGRGGTYSRDVQRCTNVTNDENPDYWDVTYVFRGQEHHVQMTSPPGSSITVNAEGEPRM